MYMHVYIYIYIYMHTYVDISNCSTYYIKKNIQAFSHNNIHAYKYIPYDQSIHTRTFPYENFHEHTEQSPPRHRQIIIARKHIIEARKHIITARKHRTIAQKFPVSYPAKPSRTQTTSLAAQLAAQQYDSHVHEWNCTGIS